MTKEACNHTKHIYDYTFSLTNSELDAVEQHVSTLNFKAKVLIVSKNFTGSRMREYTAKQAVLSKVSGDKMLLAVDVSGKQVCPSVGADLRDLGVTGEWVTQNAISTQFHPYMRKGDLKGAIVHTLDAVDAKLIEARAASKSVVVSSPIQAEQQVSTTVPVPSYDAQPANVNLMPALGFVAAAAAVVFMGAIFGMLMKRRHDAEERKETYSRLKKSYNRLNAMLYARSTNNIDVIAELAMANNFLSPKHSELQKTVDAFFSHIKGLQKLEEELNQLVAKRQTDEANETLRNLIELASNLVKQKDRLLRKVNEAIKEPDKEDAEETMSSATVQPSIETVPEPVLPNMKPEPKRTARSDGRSWRSNSRTNKPEPKRSARSYGQSANSTHITEVHNHYESYSYGRLPNSDCLGSSADTGSSSSWNSSSRDDSSNGSSGGDDSGGSSDCGGDSW